MTSETVTVGKLVSSISSMRIMCSTSASANTLTWTNVSMLRVKKAFESVAQSLHWVSKAIPTHAGKSFGDINGSGKGSNSHGSWAPKGCACSVWEKWFILQFIVLI